jgi:hypothetical protein
MEATSKPGTAKPFRPNQDRITSMFDPVTAGIEEVGLLMDGKSRAGATA